MTLESNDPRDAALIARAREIAARSIGNTVRVRTDKNVVTEGVIRSAEPHRFGHTARTKYIVFRVVAVCGTKQVEREFFLKSLPTN
ncbi:hypothetical protein [Paraburkholderia sp. HD33-4]|uniref:hypothetical protein n=1 Tax=Paraburkholderia sp. HD33-4 TaxID=2883242 RepID=UPI001F3D202D|nr:hypothetical protein [Paraburkholderia sp. HD33-4]